MYNKQIKKMVLFACCGFLLLATSVSCRKDVIEYRPYPATLPEIDYLLTQVPGTATLSIFTFSGPVPDTVLTTSSGVRIFLTDTEQLFAAAAGGQGVPCSTCQSLRIDVTELLRKGDMISREKPSVDTDNQLLESGGGVNISVLCNGQPLTLLPDRNLKVQIPGSNLKSDMSVYTGAFDGFTFKGWENSSEPVYLANWPSPTQPGNTQEGYELYPKKLGWICAARVIDPTENTLCVELPAGFSNQNTRVYVVLKHERSLTPLLIDPTTGKFCFPNAPSGTLVQLVSISKQGGQYYLAHRETEIGTNQTLSIDPVATSESDVISYLQGL